MFLVSITVFYELEALLKQSASPAIIQERIDILKEEYGALERLLWASEIARAALASDKRTLELDYARLQDRVRSLRGQLVELRGECTG